MNRLAACLALALLAAGAAEAGAAPRRYRDVRAEYVSAGGVTEIISGDTFVNGDRYGATSVPTRAGDLTMDVTIVDESGTAVAAELQQDLDGDGGAETLLAAVCGKATGLRLRKPGRPVEVYLLAGTCDNAPSVPVRGVVTARLYSAR